MKKLLAAAVAFCALGTGASAATILADVVIDYFDSGAGPIAGPYGGTWVPANYPVAVPLTYATDGDPNTFVSLPTGSYITLGFSSGFVFDGPGNDIFVSEPGEGFEDASVYVSSDGGATFSLLGTAYGNTLTELDLADIGFAGQVNAVKIVGLDNGGGSPGFDVAYVEGLEGSVVVNPVPLPAGLPLLAGSLAILGFIRRRRLTSATEIRHRAPAEDLRAVVDDIRSGGAKSLGTIAV